MKSRFGRAVLGTLVGAAPGVILVLLAQFVIKGEIQLTVGATGIMIAVTGAIVGFIVGVNKST